MSPEGFLWEFQEEALKESFKYFLWNFRSFFKIIMDKYLVLFVEKFLSTILGRILAEIPGRIPGLGFERTSEEFLEGISGEIVGNSRMNI